MCDLALALAFALALALVTAGHALPDDLELTKQLESVSSFGSGALLLHGGEQQPTSIAALTGPPSTPQNRSASPALSDDSESSAAGLNTPQNHHGFGDRDGFAPVAGVVEGGGGMGWGASDYMGGAEPEFGGGGVDTYGAFDGGPAPALDMSGGNDMGMSGMVPPAVAAPISISTPSTPLHDGGGVPR